jgi:acetyltransferase-like isoleucine patch superfamily enzyme
MKKIISVFLLVFPWRLRRLILIAFFRYKIHPTAKIGFSIICPDRLEMEQGSSIGNLTACKGLALLRLDDNASIGNLNWVTGFSVNDKSSFSADQNRQPKLIVGAHAAITNRHFIDCTNSVQIGRFTTFAGCGSQILTHSIDLIQCRQASRPVIIGEYCFVGTGSILLGGSSLPDYSVLAAGSVLNKSYTTSYVLYAGSPARAIKLLPADMGYFQRKIGFVH